MPEKKQKEGFDNHSPKDSCIDLKCSLLPGSVQPLKAYHI